MRIGFTGTRNGMSPDQLETLACLMQFEWTRLPTRATHGDCVGADAQFFDIATRLGIETESRPGISKRFAPHASPSAFRAYTASDIKHPPEPYYDRNRKIVEQCSLLLACPAARHGKGGTWYTIKHAIKVCKPVVIIYPDGTTERHH